jgi:peptidoglycan-associated lipoprotein
MYKMGGCAVSINPNGHNDQRGGFMKKVIILSMVCLLIFAFAVSCKPKAKQAPPPPPPQVKEQPKVEKVEQAPVVKKPELTEEEIFMAKSLEEINRQLPLRMIYFDYDKYAIREDAKPTLEANATWLRKFKTAKILIEGHCDERGTEDYNLALGEKRAKSAFDYLLSLGIAQDRLKTISYGKSQLQDMGHDEAAWQKNRRAQFTIIEK